jgi:Divergent InlB B-repeat domain
MKARIAACVAAAALLSSASLYAGTIDVYCDLTESGDYATYGGITHYEFGDDEPDTVYVGGTYAVLGTDNFDTPYSGYMEKPSIWNAYQGRTYIEDEFSYPIAPQGGCDNASISAQCYYGQPDSVWYETTTPMCYYSSRCLLTVNVNSGGYVTGSDATGYYDCQACVTLAAYPYTDWKFDGWSGDVSSDQPVITVCMNGQDRNETALFSEEDPPPPGGGTDNPPSNGDPTDRNGAVSPIVINFGGGEYDLTGANDPVLFDIAATGAARKIGWTGGGADEAFLWLDRNHDGRVNDGAELFGNATRLNSGLRASNGFAALRELDENRDGIIDPGDAIWPQLRLWRDANHDGVSQANEISNVASSSITAIGLNDHWTGRRDRFGNLFAYEAPVWMRRPGGPPTPRPLYDIFFVPVE